LGAWLLVVAVAAAAAPLPLLLPADAVPQGTVTLTKSWTLGGVQPPDSEHELTASCTSTLRYDGSRTIEVDETFTWHEHRVVHFSGGDVSEQTLTRTGSFHGQIRARDDLLSFRRDGAVAAYSSTVTIPRERMQVEEQFEETLSGPDKETRHTSSTSSYLGSCWEQGPGRATPTTISGTTGSLGSLSGTTSFSETLSDTRLEGTIEWQLAPRGTCSRPAVRRPADHAAASKPRPLPVPGPVKGLTAKGHEQRIIRTQERIEELDNEIQQEVGAEVVKFMLLSGAKVPWEAIQCLIECSDRASTVKSLLSLREKYTDLQRAQAALPFEKGVYAAAFPKEWNAFQRSQTVAGFNERQARLRKQAANGRGAGTCARPSGKP
jgi:hypothetical protein